MFDPSKHEGNDRNPVTPGDKVVAFVRVGAEATTKNAATYNPCTLVVLHDRVAAPGEKGDKGALLFDDLFSGEKSAWRLAQVCRAVGNITPFDNTQIDQLRKRLMLDKDGASVALVVTVANESYTKNDGSTGTKAKITAFKPYGGEWGADFDDLIEKGEANAKKAADKRGAKPGGGSGSGAGGSGGGQRRPADDGIPGGGGSGFDDDSIPF